jgi:rare lipoprotein A
VAAGRPVARSRVELARVPALVLGLAAAVVAGGVLLGCAGHAEARRPARAAGAGRPARGAGDVETGHASYYGPKFNGRRTASGERYDPRKLTAAHKSLPLGTWIRVTRTSGGGDGPSIDVRVNDRCGCTHGRVVDLSQAAAQHLHMLSAGVVPVRIEVLHR